MIMANQYIQWPISANESNVNENQYYSMCVYVGYSNHDIVSNENDSQLMMTNVNESYSANEILSEKCDIRNESRRK